LSKSTAKPTPQTKRDDTIEGVMLTSNGAAGVFCAFRIAMFIKN
jgi:hypothetical protein